jgi:hypothetical protein
MSIATDNYLYKQIKTIILFNGMIVAVILKLKDGIIDNESGKSKN